MSVKPTIQALGVDVAKDWLDMFDGQDKYHIDNQPQAIEKFLSRFEGKLYIAVEPTSAYHMDIVMQALADGHCVYLVDAYRLFRYREAVGVRAKTDKQDPLLLHRYLLSEKTHLKPYTPASQVVQSLFSLLKIRAKIMQTKVALTQSFSHHQEVGKALEPVIQSVKQAVKKIDETLLQRVKETELEDDYQRCCSIPGIGPLNGFALTAIYHRGVFRNADAFVAYLGLDVRVRDSGYYRGKRKLTKKGHAEVRRLLFNAARSGAQTVTWAGYYDAMRTRGLSATAAYNALARKLARLAFALLRDETRYRRVA